VGLGVQLVYGPDVVAPGMNRTAILDLEVKNVDAEFELLKDVVKDWVFSPTNQSWGIRTPNEFAATFKSSVMTG
jgi:hypothetical protein